MAQKVEHLTSVREIVGSNPGADTSVCESLRTHTTTSDLDWPCHNFTLFHSLLFLSHTFSQMGLFMDTELVVRRVTVCMHVRRLRLRVCFVVRWAAVYIRVRANALVFVEGRSSRLNLLYRLHVSYLWLGQSLSLTVSQTGHRPACMDTGPIPTGRLASETDQKLLRYGLVKDLIWKHSCMQGKPTVSDTSVYESLRTQTTTSDLDWPCHNFTLFFFSSSAFTCFYGSLVHMNFGPIQTKKSEGYLI